MKIIFFCFLSIFVFSISVAQVKTFDKADELQKFVERGGKYEETAPNIYKLTYRTGEIRVFNFNPAPKQTNFTANIDTTIINVWEIDTLLYYHKFSFWQRVDIVNSYQENVPLGDNNKNGRIELYGFGEVNYPFVGPVVIFEQDTQGIFRKIYSYDSNSVFVQGIGDVDSDGNNEIHLKVNDTLNGKFYGVDSLNALPTTLYFTFYHTPFSQINDMTFGDFDNDKITDCVYIEGAGVHKCIIGEYRESLKNFTTTFQFSDVEPGDFSGFGINDCDMDSKIELLLGTTMRKMFIIEAQGVNQYELIYEGIAPTYNAYMITQTNDIDKNGKPEFWIGGQDFGDGTSKIMCYEAEGDNSYAPVAYIELRYLVSLNTNYLQAADIDNDGVEELVISLGNYLIILKFSGFPNHHDYKILYAKINELTQVGAQFLPATIFDLNHDGRMDILLQMDKSTISTTQVFSYLLIQDTMTTLLEGESNMATELEFFQSYPNPFNHRTNIKFNVDKRSFTSIKVYNILGKEVKTLIEREISPGSYTLNWEGKDSNGEFLPSGVYLICFNTGNHIKTSKSILLK